MKFIITAISLVVLFTNCSSQHALTIKREEEQIAFPGAEGFGKFTTGGRGGKVMIVSNLNDTGAGSFRAAVTAKQKRIIVFDVSGTIRLNSPLRINGDCSIAGQSAPGDGICIADEPVILAGDNIIVRFLRFRMGDKNQKGGMKDGNGADDAFGGTKRKNIIIDHCSMSWSTDEVFSVYGGDSTTLQWNIISEPLNYSYHFETGDKDFERHGFGGIWGGKHLSGHHNLFAHCNNRTPRFDGIRNVSEENVDFRNNVIYNWGQNNAYAGEGGSYNVVNNYYRFGPSTKSTVKFRVVNPYKRDPDIGFGKFFVSGNYVDGSPENTANNQHAVDLEKGSSADKEKALQNIPIVFTDIKEQSAVDAYNLVLAGAGCNLPKRDSLDKRIINDVKNRTGNLIDVQGGYAHGTEFIQTLNAWPTLLQGFKIADTDNDGMPDEWEKKHGLDANNPSDASANNLDKHYTNIEVWLNSIVKK